MPKTQDKIEKDLKELGFAKTSDHDDSLVLNLSSQEDNGEKKGSKVIPWAIQRWSVGRSDGQWATDHIDFSVSLKQLTKRLRHAFQSLYGSHTKLDVIPALNQGAWILVELTHNRVSKDLTKKHQHHECAHFPHGILGFHFNLSAEGPNLLLQMSKHFLIGYTPSKILCELPTILLKCLDFKHEKITSKLGLFETIVGFDHVLNYVISQSRNPEVLKTVGFKGQADDIQEFQNAIQLKCGFDPKSGWNITITNIESSFVNLDVPPIEIVETRDLERKFAYIDQLVLGQKMEAAKKLCQSALDEGESSLFIYRRLCFIHFWQKKSLSKNYLDDMLLNDPDNLLFLSAAVQSALNNEDRGELLKHLSHLGQLLQERMTEFDDIGTFDMVLPELLGDGWSDVDLSTAQVCYQRVVQSRGDVPRVLRKMVGIARETKDSLGEIRLLNRLVEVEKRKTNIAESYMRLSELYKENDQKLASEKAITGWKLYPTNTAYAHYAADSLVEVGEFQKAIRVLDDCLKMIQNHKDSFRKASLELAISKIWFEHLKRKDLAKIRLESAIKLDERNMENLLLCENLALKLASSSLTLDLQEKIFFLAIESKNRDQVFRTISILMNHYKSSQDSEMKISLLYQTMIEHYLVSADELYSLLKIGNLDIDWYTLIDNIKAHILKENVSRRQPYYIFLGELVLDKLSNRDLAAEFYEKAMEFGKVESNIYDFLNEFYSNNGKSEKRVSLLKNRLQNTSGKGRKAILNDLFYTSQSLTDPEYDAYGILMLKELSDDLPIKKRLSLYQEKGNISGIDRVLEDIKSEISDKFEQIQWLRYVLELLNGVQKIEGFELIEKILQEIKGEYADPLEWYELGIEYHKMNPKEACLEPYLNELVLHGIPPKIDSEKVLRVLKIDSPAKGLYYQYLATKEINPKQAADHLRESFKILRRLVGYENVAFKVLERLSEIVLMNREELDKYYELAVKGLNLKIFEASLEKQLSMTVSLSDFTQIKPILQKLIDDHENKKLPIIRSYLNSLSLYEENELEATYHHLMNLNYGYREYLPESWGISYIREHQSFSKDKNAYKKILRWILEEPQNVNIITSILKMTLEDLQRNDEIHKLIDFVELGIEYDISFKKFLWTAFVESRKIDNIEKALRYWMAAVKKIENPIQWDKFIDETKNVLNDDDVLRVFLKESFGSKDEISQRIYGAIRMEYALCLFASDLDAKLAHSILDEIYVDDKTESRVWIPLYFLKSTLHKNEELYELLFHIIPKVAEKTELIGSFPLTVESLLKEFKQLAEDLDRSDFLPDLVYEPKKAPSSSKAMFDLSEQANVLDNLHPDGDTGMLINEEIRKKAPPPEERKLTATQREEDIQEGVTKVIAHGSEQDDHSKTSVEFHRESQVSQESNKHTQILNLDEVLAQQEKDEEATAASTMPELFSSPKDPEPIQEKKVETQKSGEANQFGQFSVGDLDDEPSEATKVLDLGMIGDDSSLNKTLVENTLTLEEPPLIQLGSDDEDLHTSSVKDTNMSSSNENTSSEEGVNFASDFNDATVVLDLGKVEEKSEVNEDKSEKTELSSFESDQTLGKDDAEDPRESEDEETHPHEEQDKENFRTKEIEKIEILSSMSILDSQDKEEGNGGLEEKVDDIVEDSIAGNDEITETRVQASPPQIPVMATEQSDEKAVDGQDSLIVSTMDLPPPNPISEPLQEDWRALLRRFDAEKILPKLTEIAYSSNLDKYLALQSGVFHDQEGFSLLSDMNWLDFVKPWDQNEDAPFIPDSLLIKAIQRFKPEIEKSYQKELNLKYIASIYNLSIDRFLGEREYIKFTDLFAWPWAEVYESQIQQIPFELVFIDSSEDVIYESRQRVLYVGKTLAISPSPRLLFKVLFNIRSVQSSVHELIHRPALVRAILLENRSSFTKTDQQGLDELLDEKEFNKQVEYFKDLIVRQLLNETRNLTDIVRFDKELFGYQTVPQKRKRVLLSLMGKIKNR